MNALDAKIDQNRQRVAENLWQTGLIRTDYIDRSSVYDAFQKCYCWYVRRGRKMKYEKKISSLCVL